MNYFSDESEWQWLFQHGLLWDKLQPLYAPTVDRQEYRDSLKEILTTTGKWASEKVAKRAPRLDNEGAGVVKDGQTFPGPALQELYREAVELGLMGPTMPADLGGLELPSAIGLLILGQVSRGCAASATQLGFFSCITDMLYRFCDQATIDRLVPQIIEGKLSGAMCLTEPGCGSDLGTMKTSATPQADGQYLLNGTKIFITNGGGGLNFTLARIKGAPEGLSGISLFLLEQKNPDQSLNYQVTKNEDKIGMHGSFTCEVLYQNSVGRLVGKENEGMKLMFHLMNEARIATSFQALAGIEACLHYVREYGETRTAFGQKLNDLPLFKRNLEDCETERDALRALLVDSLNWFDLYQRLDLKKRKTGDLNSEESNLYKLASRWSRKRTPLLKFWATEQFTLISQRSIQMLGGHGLMKDHPVERWHRDSFGPLLYEGTSQIQSLMAVKDVVKYALTDPQKFFGSIFANHPMRSAIQGDNAWGQAFKKERFRFKKKLLGLLLKSLKPENKKIFDAKSWMQEENVQKILIHAESIAQGLTFMETLRVLAQHADIEASRSNLFDRYLRLTLPRLEAIYKDWEIRS